MAKKKEKGGKKGKKASKEDIEGGDAASLSVLHEVDKTFYELQITDLNRKLARLRELTQDLETKNTDWEQKYSKLDEDRGDVISYLKRNLEEKQAENNELQERLVALQEAKDAQEEDFAEKVKDMEKEYEVMREQLTSEIKLLSGKLNALEEFRLQREDILKKFEAQETIIEQQDLKHKEILYETEKKFIIGKDVIKKEMEKRLMDLAADFQAANEMRIAATTQRVIRENIAINNEMENIMDLVEKLTNENEGLKQENVKFKLNNKLYLAERNKALACVKVHRGLVTDLTKKYQDVTVEVDRLKTQVDNGRIVKTQLKEQKAYGSSLLNKIRILEQNYYAKCCNEAELRQELCKAQKHLQLLKEVIFDCILAIKDVMEVKSSPDLSLKITKKEDLLGNLLKMLTSGQDIIVTVPSIETVEAVDQAYYRGDLGLVPGARRESFVPLYHAEVQTGGSLLAMPKISSLRVSDSEASFLPISSTKSGFSRVTIDEITMFSSYTEESSSKEEGMGEEEEKLDEIQKLQSFASVMEEEMYGEGVDYNEIEFKVESEHETLTSIHSTEYTTYDEAED